MSVVTFQVPGKPQGKARARTFYNVAAGKHTSVTPDRTVLYENLIKEQFLSSANGFHIDRDKPVFLSICAKFLPPKSTPKKKREEMIGRNILPLKKPDMDNIVKVVADALNGVAYYDDTQIALLSASKIYSDEEGLDIVVGEYKTGK